MAIRKTSLALAAFLALASGARVFGFLNPGPDVIVGDLLSVEQFGRVGSVVGLAVGTTSCNKGDDPLNWFSMPNTDHPVIPQNLYRLKNDQFEQIGQSWLKHAFTALQQNACGFGCQGGCSGSQLCPGCSDPYVASLNAGQSSLGSRAWVNPFTGAFTSGANNHSGHVHNGIAHRVQVNDADLDQNLNAGAMYFAEGQYVTPHEYLPNNGVANNQFNNVSYRQYLVSGVSGGTYTFLSSGATVRERPAVYAWSGATIKAVEPAPGQDGLAYVAYKVTGPIGLTWHYEYAVYNMNLDRAIGEFVVPIAPNAVITNIGFHGPPQHAGFSNDGTAGNQGYSSTPWATLNSPPRLHWMTETFAENPNANAIRWGTLYNFRFDADRAPVPATLTLGMFKTGGIATISAAAPDADCNSNNIGDSSDIHNGTSQDCNANLVPDSCDIANKTSKDSNGNGIPDECDPIPCLGDIAPNGGDGSVDVGDLVAVLSAWGACAKPCPPSCPEDVVPKGGDCAVNVSDLLAVIAAWGPCP